MGLCYFRDGGFATSWTLFAFKSSICNVAQTHKHGTDFIGELMSETTIAANTPSFSASKFALRVVVGLGLRSRVLLLWRLFGSTMFKRTGKSFRENCNPCRADHRSQTNCASPHAQDQPFSAPRSFRMGVELGRKLV
jgi:hypothetical protein